MVRQPVRGIPEGEGSTLPVPTRDRPKRNRGYKRSRVFWAIRRPAPPRLRSPPLRAQGQEEPGPASIC